LIEALDDDDARVRGRACRALGAVGPGAKEALPALRAMLKKRKDDLSQIDDATTMLLIDPKAAGAVEALKHDFVQGTIPEDAAGVLAAAALALVEDERKGTFPVLLKGLDDRAFGIGIRLKAIQGLARIGPKASGVLPALRNALRDDHDGNKIEAAAAILKAGGKPEDILPVLTRALKNDYSRWRREAAAVLKSMGRAAKPAVKDLKPCTIRAPPRRESRACRFSTPGPETAMSAPPSEPRIKDWLSPSLATASRFACMSYSRQ
jgi:HEAT repeat protein